MNGSQPAHFRRPVGLVLAFSFALAPTVMPARAQTMLDQSQTNCATLEADGQGVILTAPDRLVFDREGSVKVVGVKNAKVEHGRLAFIGGQGEELFGHALTPTEITTVNHPDEYVRFPIRVGSAGGPVVVRLSYRWRHHGTEQICDTTRDLTVSPFEGVSPRPRLYWSDYTRLDLRVVCERLAPGELRVVFRHRGRKRTMLLRTERCGPGSLYRPGGSYVRWSQRGAAMPGLRFYRNDPLNAYHVGGHDWTHIYRVDVFWKSQPILHRWLWARNQHDPARRIYEDEADDFYTYCAGPFSEGSYAVRKDAHGKSYCVKPAIDHERGHVFPTPPPWH